MSIDYEREGKRENPNKVDAEWPQLIVPEWTNKGQRTTKPGRRAAQSKQETTGRQRTVRSESTVSKKKRTAPSKRASAERRKVSKSRVSASKRKDVRGKKTMNAAGVDSIKAKAAQMKENLLSGVNMKKLSAGSGKAADLIPALKRMTGFSETQSNKAIFKKTKHVLLFPIVFLYFEILLRILGKTGIFAHIVYPIIFSIAAGLFLACITSFFKRKVNRIISITALFAVGVLFIAECLIKDSFQVYMNFKSILSGAGGVMGEFSSELINSIIFGIPVILLFFLPGILYIVFGKKKLPARRQKPEFVLALLVCSLIFMVIGSLTASIGKSKAQYKTQYDFNTATQYFGLMTSVRLDGKYAIFGNEQASDFGIEETAVAENEEKEKESEEKAEEPKEYGENVVDLDLTKSTSNEAVANMHNYVDSLTPSKQNEYTGLFEGKNLILICAEALSDVVIDKELTPTLYRMVHNGFYFSEYYQPTWGGSTSSGEFSFITGLAPTNGVKTIQETKNNNLYYTMGSQLQRQGYFSRCYHNGTHDYYSRNETHENLGYDQFLALGNGLEDITGQYPGDEKMFDLTMDTYIDQQPFSIYYMTISGHCPYKAKNAKVKENLDTVKARYGNKYKDTTNYYFCYNLELEKALTTMIKKLEDAGIADDTVICMTADHYPYGLEKTSTFGNTEDYVTDLYGYKPKNSWEKDHNTLVIWSGCLENEKKDMACEIDTPTYSLDVVPTLSNLFGLEYDSRLLVGRDVFSDAEPLALWTNYSWVTKEGKYDSASGKFYPNEGVTVDDDYVEKMKGIVKNKLNYSTQAVKNDYFGVLFD